jgi:hypothetical protein
VDYRVGCEISPTSSEEECKGEDETGNKILLRCPYRLIKRDGVSVAFWEGAIHAIAWASWDKSVDVISPVKKHNHHPGKPNTTFGTLQ